MDRVANGDREAFGLLLHRYWRPLVIYAAAITGTEDSAKDVVQQAFIRVWRHRERWKRTGSASAYLYRIAHNEAHDERRRVGARRRCKERQKLESAPMRGPPTPADLFTLASVRKEIQAAVDALPERRRKVFILARFHGLNHREIAEVMGVSTQTVANQMSAALTTLRAALAHLLEPG